MASDTVTFLVALVAGASSGGTAYVAAKWQFRSESKRLEVDLKRLEVEGERIVEGRSEQFGAFRRGVYRGFFDLLDYYPDQDTPNEEREEWHKSYRRRLNILLLTAGPEVLEKVRAANTDNPEALAKDRRARDELLEAMREEIFQDSRENGRDRSHSS